MRTADSLKTTASRRDLRRRRRWMELMVHGILLGASLTALVMIALIFLFVGREALPVLLGQVNTALVQDVLPIDQALRLPPDQLRSYLDLTRQEFDRLDSHARRELIALKVEAQEQIPAGLREDPEAQINTLAWKYILLPHAWTGYTRPAFIWQPISRIRKFNVLPLITGSLKVAAVAMATAVPLALAAALFVARFAPARFKTWIKSAIELLAGVPSVVMGFLALVVLATVLEGPVRAVGGMLGIPTSRLNACVAGLALGFAVLPIIFTVAEQALSAVPSVHAEAALALGANRWQTAWQVVVPSALPGLIAAVVLGFGRAMSDTMIVLMASGNAALMSANIFQPTRTLTATVAAEMDEAVFGGPHYRMLFLVGMLLLAMTFATNLVADAVIRRFKKRLESRR